MRTFCISTLGCKVNHYESEQIASLLERLGLVRVDQPERADLRVVNTCSVTIQAGSKSRQTIRQTVRRPVVSPQAPAPAPLPCGHGRQRTIVTGCWATSDKAEASSLPGVCAVVGHDQDVARKIEHLLTLWQTEDQTPSAKATRPANDYQRPPESSGDDGWIDQAGSLAYQLDAANKAQLSAPVKGKIAEKDRVASSPPGGTIHLPQLGSRQASYQRAMLKIQDGCDAHCTYCIIPRLRSRVWSRPIEQVVEEARRLVAAGHMELVLTGIFLGAYGQTTALRHRQIESQEGGLARLVQALCTSVPGLLRLRLSSLEPGDLTDSLLHTLRSFPQAVPHFHLPLQSGSPRLLRRMNRQYTREDYLRMVDRVRAAFDRPALTTDIIVGFPGETDEEFKRTLDVVDRCGFTHVHAFPFSPRPGTAASKWRPEFIPNRVARQRIEVLRQRSTQLSLAFRQQFLQETVEILVEKPSADEYPGAALQGLQHGRCERYFSIFFEADCPMTGELARIRIDRVLPGRTMGTLVGTGVVGACA